MDFVRYHKRTTRNFHAQLQEIVSSKKQTVIKGIQGGTTTIAINSVRLNKSCTVANVFWSLNMLAPELVNEQYRIFQAHNSQAYIESERA